jgi:hypothetical protein
MCVCVLSVCVFSNQEPVWKLTTWLGTENLPVTPSYTFLSHLPTPSCHAQNTLDLRNPPKIKKYLCKACGGMLARTGFLALRWFFTVVCFLCHLSYSVWFIMVFRQTHNLVTTALLKSFNFATAPQPPP